jgi:hypothetical protein
LKSFVILNVTEGGVKDLLYPSFHTGATGVPTLRGFRRVGLKAPLNQFP